MDVAAPRESLSLCRRRGRPTPTSVLVLLVVTAGLPFVSGFGLSAVGQGAAAASLSAVADGALFRRRSAAAAAAAAAASVATSSERSRRRRDSGNGISSRRRRGERRGGNSRHSVITCKVSGPRKYGSSDWLNNMQNLPKSRLLYNIREHLWFNTGFAFLVSMVHYLTPQHIIDDLHVSPIPHSIMSGALGLLLVFRTNAAYNRFWEARKVWGGVTNTCRSMARLGAVALGPDSVEWQEIKEYLKMFPWLLKQHLQDDRADEELSFSNLPNEKILRVQEDPNPPLYACQRMSEVVARAYSEGGTGQSEGGRVPDFTSVTYRMEMERCLTSLIDALGMCERILTTPVPRGYSRHTSRFLTVYGVTLPVVLVPHTELFTAPVVGAVCWGLFSIEEIAYFIEQPFDPEYKQLDLQAYATKIAGDVERMTVASSLGRHGPSSSPQLPGSYAKGFLSSSWHQQQQQRQPPPAWRRPLNGSGGEKDDESSTTAAGGVKAGYWGGEREDDIIS